MSIITNITGMPLFTTIQEAIDWGRGRGLSGYHTHTVNGVLGYMGGATHAAAVPKANITPPTITAPQTSAPIPARRARVGSGNSGSSSSGGSGGSSSGGGGGGY